MNNKSKDKRFRRSGFKIRKAVQTVLFLCFTVIAGIVLGNVLNVVDINKTIQKVNIEFYKSILDESSPIVNSVYNNGSLSTSFSSEFKNLINSVFSFDMSNPISFLNSQSSFLNSYYTSSYLAALDEQNKKSGNEGTPDTQPETEPGTQTDTKIAGNLVPNDNGSGGYEEAASSISTGDGVENTTPPKSEIVSTGKITIKNETSYKVNIDELLKESLKFKFDKTTDKVLIFHTHTTESYIGGVSQLSSTVSTRTTDPRYSVVRVGEELADKLRDSFGFKVIHNATIHDYPDYNNSYNNSLKTVTTILKAYPSIKIVIDLHRNAISNTQKLREVATVNGKKAAKIMFVVATGEQKNNEPNWKENLKLALKIQKRLLEQCPELTKSIELSQYRYNQHVSPGALLIEVGGDGNLLSECLESTKYLAKAINDVVSK